MVKIKYSNRFNKKSVPVPFSIVKKGKLISRAEVIRVDLIHSGLPYKVYGISNVFTCLQFRRKWYGKKVVKSATNYILQSDADIGLLFCNSRFESFYASIGWEAQNNSIVRIGAPDNYMSYDSFKMMLFVSKKGKDGQAAFTSQPLYIRYIL